MSFTHEDFRSRVEHGGPSDRSFGVVFTLFFVAAGVAPLRHAQPMRVWCLALALVLLAAAIFKPSSLRWPNRLWIGLGVALGKVVNPVVTTLLFYLVFTPMGLMLRLLKKDLLQLRREPAATSYWQSPNLPEGGPDMRNQF
jgi:hypothetical protein